jgi:hypothetical protein
MKLYNTLKESLAYELDNYSEDYRYPEGLSVDLERTTRRIWQHMKQANALNWYRSRAQWEGEESAHMAVMDWLSMFEPTFYMPYSFEYKCWKCPETHMEGSRTEQERAETLANLKSMDIEAWPV